MEPSPYQQFIAYVTEDCRRERNRVNQRMAYVVLWCFVLPLTFSFLVGLGLRSGLLPKEFRRWADWSVLVFPILYSIYVVGREVLPELPNVFREGGISATLRQFGRDAQWRTRVASDLEKLLPKSDSARGEIATHFGHDLMTIRQRVQYLSALAGAVFLFVVQILDNVDESDVVVSTDQGWVLGLQIMEQLSRFSNSLIQLGTLLVFLTLFYLAGIQTHTVLHRYLVCLELVRSGSRRPSSTTAP